MPDAAILLPYPSWPQSSPNIAARQDYRTCMYGSDCGSSDGRHVAADSRYRCSVRNMPSRCSRSWKSGWVACVVDYRPTDGRKVIEDDSRTLKIFDTDEIIRKVR